jgi:hypothetical protein
MPAIVRSLVLVAFAVALLYGDAHEEAIKLIGSVAAALSTVNVPAFMDAFDKNMPDYGKLQADVAALVNQADVGSSIEPIADEGDDVHRTMDLDWYLEVRSLVQDGPIVHRRQVIHCELRKEKKKWKIIALKPLDFFAPAALDK